MCMRIAYYVIFIVLLKDEPHPTGFALISERFYLGRVWHREVRVMKK